MGSIIIENQHNKGWGAKIIPNLAKDLAKEFPQLKGFWQMQPKIRWQKVREQVHDRNTIQTYNQIQLKLKDTPPANATIAKLLQSNENEFVQQVAAQLQNTDNHVVRKAQKLASALLHKIYFYNLF